jgi:flagellar biosynthesis/type III secretory pathway protein FliH
MPLYNLKFFGLTIFTKAGLKKFVTETNTVVAEEAYKKGYAEGLPKGYENAKTQLETLVRERDHIAQQGLLNVEAAKSDGYTKGFRDAERKFKQPRNRQGIYVRKPPVL